MARRPPPSQPDSRELGGPVASRWVGHLGGASEPIEAAAPFVLAGAQWRSPPRARIQLRARSRRTGTWTAWAEVSVLGHDSEPAEAPAHALIGEPVWTGVADAFQLRSDRTVEGLCVYLVAAADAGPAAADVGPAAAEGLTAQALPLAQPRLPAGPGQPPVIARRAWAGDLLPRAAPAYGDVRMAFVHHSTGANGYGANEVPAILRSIYYFHTAVRGWNDIGYNFALDAYGRTWEARAGGIDRPVVGAQAGGYNLESFGAVVLGDFSSSLPSPAALRALRDLVAWKLSLHGVPARGDVTVEVDPPAAFYTRFRPGQHVSLPRVAAHRDGCTTDCPGGDMYLHGMPPLRAAVERLAASPARLTLEPGPAPGSAYALAPYGIDRSVRSRPASYLRLAAVTLTAGAALTLHGSLRAGDRGGGLPAATVLIQQLLATRHDQQEVTVMTATTGSDGSWSAALAPRESLLLRALHAEAPAVSSALLALGVAPRLTLTLVRRAGSEVELAGTVWPGKPRVLVEVRSQTARHRLLHHVHADVRHGSFSVRLTLGAGSYLLVARAPADATNVAGVSAALELRV